MCMVKVLICIILILLLILLYLNRLQLRKYFERFDTQTTSTCLKKPLSNSEVFESSMDYATKKYEECVKKTQDMRALQTMLKEATGLYRDSLGNFSVYIAIE